LTRGGLASASETASRRQEAEDQGHNSRDVPLEYYGAAICRHGLRSWQSSSAAQGQTPASAAYSVAFRTVTQARKVTASR
jgi:hypothetical protein